MWKYMIWDTEWNNIEGKVWIGTEKYWLLSSEVCWCCYCVGFSSDCVSQKGRTFRILLRVKKNLPQLSFPRLCNCLLLSLYTKQSSLVFCSWVFPAALTTCLWACLSCESSDLLWSHFFLFRLSPCLFQFNFILILSHYGKWFFSMLAMNDVL